MLTSCMRSTVPLATSVQLLFVIKDGRKGNRLPAEQESLAQAVRHFLDGELDGVDDEIYFIATRRQQGY